MTQLLAQRIESQSEVAGTPTDPVVRTPSKGAVFRALSWVAAGHVAGQAFWMGSLLILAALLAPRAFGTITVGLLMVSAATGLMGAGTRGTIVMARDLRREHLVSALTVNVGLGLLLSTLIAILAGPISNFVVHGTDPTALRVLGLSTVLYAPAIVPLALVEKRFLFKRKATVQAVARMTGSTAAVVAALLGAGIWALVIRQLLFQALLPVGAWIAARGLWPPADEHAKRMRWARLKRLGASSFVAFVLTDFLVFNADYMVVGRLTNATQLGLYSLAFTIAFAPVTLFSAQLGGVLFPATASSDPDAVRRRTLAGVRLACLVVFPLVAIGIALAPVFVPLVLGQRWSGMVVPLQILIAVGAAHAVLNLIGESLAGTGNIVFRARVNVVWMLGMFGSLVFLVHLFGIRGAALAHLFLYAPVVLAYGTYGMRLLGIRTRELGAAVAGVFGLLVTQGAVTVLAIVLLRLAGAPASASDVLGACLGAAAAAVYLFASAPGLLTEMRSFVAAGRRRA